MCNADLWLVSEDRGETRREGARQEGKTKQQIAAPHKGQESEIDDNKTEQHHVPFSSCWTWLCVVH